MGHGSPHGLQEPNIGPLQISGILEDRLTYNFNLLRVELNFMRSTSIRAEFPSGFWLPRFKFTMEKKAESIFGLKFSEVYIQGEDKENLICVLFFFKLK